MGFNGITGAVNEPGQIPWEVVVIYFVLALVFASYVGKKNGGLKAFKTIDLVYIGIGAAFSVVWEFYIGSFLGRLAPSSPFIDIGFWGRFFIVLIVAALVRKVGTGMLSLAIFNILSDLLHYGFGGEPMFTIYETLTYGLFIDLMIAVTGGKLFGTGTVSKGGATTTIIGVVEGGILGVLVATADPIFYLGFFGPFIYGYAPNWAHILFDLVAFIPGDVIIGALAGVVALRIARAVG